MIVREIICAGVNGYSLVGEWPKTQQITLKTMYARETLLEIKSLPIYFAWHVY